MRCAVLGDPIEHSLSPVLHRAAYAALGLDWTYDAVRVREPAASRTFLDGLDDEWRGLSLTMPLKREVDAAADLARRLDRGRRVPPTPLLLDADGGRHGLNTDVPGRRWRRCGEATEAHAATRRVVLGGGATAASVLLALAERGLRRATLAVRDPAPGGRDARGGGAASARARARR